MKSLSHVQLSATPWTEAYQAPLSVEFSRQEYWSGVPFPNKVTPNKCPLQISYIETLIPNVTVFGGWTFKEELRLNEVTRVGL